MSGSEVELKRFKQACYLAIQQAGGTIEQVKSRDVTPNFYRAIVNVGDSTFEIIGHSIYPLIAFTKPIEDFSLTFIDRPDLTPLLSQQGFEVLLKATLDSPPSVSSLAQLGRAELEQVNYWNAKTNGEIAFNWFD